MAFKLNSTTRDITALGGSVTVNSGLIRQPAPAAVNATATLTVADLQTRIITTTTALATNLTLPTGTLMDVMYAEYVDMGWAWSIINTGPLAATILAGTGHTIVGAALTATLSSANFCSRRTGVNTWVTYRV